MFYDVLSVTVSAVHYWLKRPARSVDQFPCPMNKNDHQAEVEKYGDDEWVVAVQPTNSNPRGKDAKTKLLAPGLAPLSDEEFSLDIQVALASKEGVGGDAEQMEQAAQRYRSERATYGDNRHVREQMARICGNIPDLVETAQRRLARLKPACDVGYEKHLQFTVRVVYALVAATLAQQVVDPVPQPVCVVCALLRRHARRYVEDLEPFDAEAKRKWNIAVPFYCNFFFLDGPKPLEMQPIPEGRRNFVMFDNPSSDFEVVRRCVEEWANMAPCEQRVPTQKQAKSKRRKRR